MESFITLIWIVLAIALVGLAVWLIEKYVPMDDVFKIAIRVIVILAVILFLLEKYLIPTIRRIHG